MADWCRVVAAIGVGAGCGGPAAPVTPGATACGDAIVGSQAQADALAACGRLGHVTVRTGVALSLRGWQATHIDVLQVGPTSAMDLLDLPHLATVGQLRLASNLSLTGVYLPALRRATTLEVRHNPALLQVMVGQLTDGERIHVTANPSLELLDLARLRTVAWLEVYDNPGLTLASWPADLRGTAGHRLERPASD